MNEIGDFETWVWGVGDEFGYIVVRVEISSNHTILRKVSNQPSLWLTGITRLDDLQRALKKRSGKTSASAYRLYRAANSEPPLCFPSLIQWLWYLDAEHRHGRAEVRSFCADCTMEHQAKMIRMDRCGHPEIDIEQEKERSLRRSATACKKRRGRPSKNQS